MILNTYAYVHQYNQNQIAEISFEFETYIVTESKPGYCNIICENATSVLFFPDIPQSLCKTVSIKVNFYGKNDAIDIKELSIVGKLMKDISVSDLSTSNDDLCLLDRISKYNQSLNYLQYVADVGSINLGSSGFKILKNDKLVISFSSGTETKNIVECVLCKDNDKNSIRYITLLGINIATEPEIEKCMSIDAISKLFNLIAAKVYIQKNNLSNMTIQEGMEAVKSVLKRKSNSNIEYVNNIIAAEENDYEMNDNFDNVVTDDSHLKVKSLSTILKRGK